MLPALSLLQYPFETEQAVLAWAKARDEAIRKAQQEEAERAAKAVAEAAAQTSSSEKEANKDDEGSSSHISGKQGMAQSDNELSTSTKTDFNGLSGDTSGQMQVSIPKLAVAPKPVPRPGPILKPTPILQINRPDNANQDIGDKNQTVSISVVGEKFDVSMFEQEADPFDNLELQTINDMEELKALLEPMSGDLSVQESGGDQQWDVSKNNHKVDNTSNAVGTSTPTNQNSQQHKPIAEQTSSSSEGFYELAGPIATDAWVRFDDISSPPSTSHQFPGNPFQNIAVGDGCTSAMCSENKNMISSSDSNLSDSGDYVKLEPAQIPPPSHPPPHTAFTSTTADSMPTHRPPSHHSIDSSVLSNQTNSSNSAPNPIGAPNLPSNLVASGLFKPVLPPIPKPRQSALISDTLGGAADAGVKSHSLQCNSATITSSTVTVTSHPNNLPSVQNEATPAQPSNNVNNKNHQKQNSNLNERQSNSNGMIVPARVAPPPPKPKPPTSAVPQPTETSSPFSSLSSSPSSKMWSSVGPSLASSLENGPKDTDIKVNAFLRHSREWHGADSSSPDLSMNANASNSPIPYEKPANSTTSFSQVS